MAISFKFYTDGPGPSLSLHLSMNDILCAMGINLRSFQSVSKRLIEKICCKMLENCLFIIRHWSVRVCVCTNGCMACAPWLPWTLALWLLVQCYHHLVSIMDLFIHINHLHTVGELQ